MLWNIFSLEIWFLVHLHLHSRLRRIQWAIVKFSNTNQYIFYFVNFRLINDKNRVGMSKNSWICLPNWKYWLIYFWSQANVDRIYLAVNLVLSIFQNDSKISVYIRNKQKQNIWFVSIELPIELFWLGGARVLGRAGLAFIFRLDTAFLFSPRWYNYLSPRYCN